MPVHYGTVLPNPTNSAWAQTYYLEPPHQKKLSCGKLIALLALKTEDLTSSNKISAVELGKEIEEKLNKEYFEKEGGTVFERLFNALSTIQNEYSNYPLVCILCVLWRGFVYFAALGRGGVFLWRNRKLNRLVDFDKQGIRMMSGRARLDDILILVTEDFYRLIGYDGLFSALIQNRGPQYVADSLLLKISPQSSPVAACLLLKLQEEDLGVENAEGNQNQEESFRGSPNLGRKFITAIKRSLASLAYKLPEKEIVIAGDKQSRRRKALILGLVLLVLLVTSIVFGFRQKAARDYKMRYVSRLQNAQAIFENSLLQKEVNPATSRELYLQAAGIIQALKDEGFRAKEIDLLAERIKAAEADILRRKTVQPSLFLDLSLVRSGIRAGDISQGKSRLVILDVAGSRLVSISIDKKETSVFGGEDKIEGARFVGAYQDKVYVFSQKGIFEFDKRGTAKVVIPKDDIQGEVFGMDVFGGNIYLGTKDGKIWRYPVAEAGFGSKQDWLAKDIAVDFSNAHSLAIDGAIWILSSDGGIYKFIRGNRDAVRFSGFDGFGKPQALYTDENLDSIFVLDRLKSAIFEFDKKGNYKLQYVAPEIKDALDFVVSKEAGKIFLLAETKVLEISLK